MGPPLKLGAELIEVLENKDCAIPENLQHEPRMLLYICHMWRDDKNFRRDRFLPEEIFWDQIWDMMMATYNAKYPEKKKTHCDLKSIRKSWRFCNRSWKFCHF